MIAKDSSVSLRSGLALRLFFVFLNTKQPFPNASLERSRVSAKERRVVAVRPCLVVPFSEVRDPQEVNYLGWDARVQRPIADFIAPQKQRWKERLRAIVSHAAAGAHKDSLWSRLFGALLSECDCLFASSSSNTDDLPLFSLVDGQANAQPFDASVGAAMSSVASSVGGEGGPQIHFSEINDILKTANVINVNSIDVRLAETLNFNIAYHDALMQLIRHTYPQQSARFSCRPGEQENGLSSAVVLIEQGYPKGFLLLTKTAGRQSVLSLLAVFQDGDKTSARDIFYKSPLLPLVRGVAELCCFLLWRKLHF